MKLATWNINSLRMRLNQLLNWIQQTKPDILALQETRAPDQAFPKKKIEAAGYFVVYSGQKLVIVGDFNIAPDDRDVYDPKVWQENVLISSKECKALQNLFDLGLIDACGLFV